jgi:hypothetical protein
MDLMKHTWHCQRHRQSRCSNRKYSVMVALVVVVVVGEWMAASLLEIVEHRTCRILLVVAAVVVVVAAAMEHEFETRGVVVAGVVVAGVDAALMGTIAVAAVGFVEVLSSPNVAIAIGFDVVVDVDADAVLHHIRCYPNLVPTVVVVVVVVAT